MTDRLDRLERHLSEVLAGPRRLMRSLIKTTTGTDAMTDTNDSAHPTIETELYYDNAAGKHYPHVSSTGGLTKRELAAIELRVPMSGDDQIDAMIRVANRRDAAAMAMQGLLSHRLGNAFPYEIADSAAAFADALIAELNKETL